MLYDPKWKPEEVEIKIEPWQEILTKARNLIKENGWTKHQLTNPLGNYCMVGALQKVSFDGVYGSAPLGAVTHLCRHKNYAAYAKAVNALNSVMKLPIYEWNDHVASSSRSVLAKFTQAINKGKPGG